VKLTRTAEWMRKLRSVTELFNRCLTVCEDDMNEARYAMVDVLGLSHHSHFRFQATCIDPSLEYLLQTLGESIKHLRTFPTGKPVFPREIGLHNELTWLGTDAAASNDWKQLNVKIKDNLTEMDNVVRHLNEINSYSKVNLERQVRNLQSRHAPVVLPDEHCTFPIAMIPRQRNQEFYGRIDELAKINTCLDYRENVGLRTYTIYGRYVLLCTLA